MICERRVCPSSPLRRPCSPSIQNAPLILPMAPDLLRRCVGWTAWVVGDEPAALAKTCHGRLKRVPFPSSSHARRSS